MKAHVSLRFINLRVFLICITCVLLFSSRFIWAQEVDSPNNLAGNVEVLLAELENGLANSADLQKKHDILVELASFYELLGDIQKAQEAYQSASFLVANSKDFPSLLASAKLLVELGEYRDAEAQARAIILTGTDQALIVGAKIVLARAYFLQEKFDAFQETYQSLMENESTDERVLALSVMGIDGENDRSAATKALALLQEMYPRSMAFALADGRISSVHTPSGLTRTHGGMESAATEELTPEINIIATEEPDAVTSDGLSDVATIDIQTGSFTNKKNAEKMVSELIGLKYSAITSSYETDSAVYYRVIVEDVPLDAVQTVLLSLKDSGFEGFPLYD